MEKTRDKFNRAAITVGAFALWILILDWTISGVVLGSLAAIAIRAFMKRRIVFYNEFMTPEDAYNEFENMQTPDMFGTMPTDEEGTKEIYFEAFADQTKATITTGRPPCENFAPSAKRVVAIGANGFQQVDKGTGQKEKVH